MKKRNPYADFERWCLKNGYDQFLSPGEEVDSWILDEAIMRYDAETNNLEPKRVDSESIPF